MGKFLKTKNFTSKIINGIASVQIWAVDMTSEKEGVFSGSKNN